jgi:hypothetical protein
MFNTGGVEGIDGVCSDMSFAACSCGDRDGSYYSKE